MNPPSYQNGKTEATLDGLAHSMDLLRGQVDRLTQPEGLCSKRGAEIEGQRQALRIVRWLCAALITIDIALASGLIALAANPPDAPPRVEQARPE